MASKAGPATASSSISRRQPPRQARTAPRKTLSKSGAIRADVKTTSSSLQPPKKFYPALASFTDAIDALPAEVIRHFTLLREVDAKACAPEARLRFLIDACESLPPPATPNERDPALEALQLLADLRRNRDQPAYAPHLHILLDLERMEALEAATPGCRTILGQPETRRARAAQIRAQISELLATQDEKVHVITTAVDAVQRHLSRVEHGFAFTEVEVPAIYRLGNADHWAYKDPMRKGTAAAQARQAERERREAEERYHTQQQQRETESNTRGEGRREKKSTHHRHDDEHPDHHRKKVRKDAETLVSAKRMAEQQVAVQQKKRKTVKEDPKGKEKASTAAAASPRAATPAVFAGNSSKKSKATTASAASGNVNKGGKSRHSAANSPRLLVGSSPPPASHPPPQSPAAAHHPHNSHHPHQQQHHSHPRQHAPPASPRVDAGGSAAAAAAAAPAERDRERDKERDRDKSTRRSVSPVPAASASAKKPKTKPRQDRQAEKPTRASDAEEELYCYCNGPSYGEMVACDNLDCEREWFHLSCVGLTVAPKKHSQWYCKDCEQAVEGRRRVGSRQQ